MTLLEMEAAGPGQTDPPHSLKTIGKPKTVESVAGYTKIILASYLILTAQILDI